MEQSNNPLHSMALNLSYNGTDFHGFAKQKDVTLRTVQGCLENALQTYFRREITTVCAGRTDAGVHARDQYISFDLYDDEFEKIAANSYKFRVSMNALTPDDISIRAIYEGQPGFSARFDVDTREYRYRICMGEVPPLFLKDFCWWHRSPLDVEAMQQAAQCLVGVHDFKSFCKVASAQDKSTVREVFSIEVYEEKQFEEDCIVVKIIGNAFLHSMVRTIVGTLAMVGTGQRCAEWVKEALEAKDRNAAGPNAPASGLTFWKVSYPEQMLNLL